MTTTLKMQAETIEDLRRELEARGFDLRPLPYGHFQARGEDVVVAAYKSGKVVVQGKGEQAFLTRQGIEGPAPTSLDGTVVGSDESGKGDYFGPLVVAAVIVKPEQVRELQRAGVRDCKKLADNATLRAAAAVRALCPHAVKPLMPPEYNEAHAEQGNVALFLATMHGEAIADALEGDGECVGVVIDQFTFPERLEAALRASGVRLPVEIRHRAEDNPAVAAASVLARSEFLLGLKELGNEIGFELPKGAGPNVERTGRRIFQAGGLELLGSVAKTHFRTTERVTGDLF